MVDGQVFICQCFEHRVGYRVAAEKFGDIHRFVAFVLQIGRATTASWCVAIAGTGLLLQCFEHDCSLPNEKQNRYRKDPNCKTIVV